MPKRYCGDGVYVEVNPGGMLLTAENGITVLQAIVLEWPVFDALLEFVNEETTALRLAKERAQHEKGLFDDDE